MIGRLEADGLLLIFWISFQKLLGVVCGDSVDIFCCQVDCLCLRILDEIILFNDLSCCCRIRRRCGWVEISCLILSR